MKLALSNLALPSLFDPRALTELARAGVAALEVAPTKIAPWDQLSTERLSRYRDELSGSGLRASSLQALFYQAGDVALLGSERQFESMRAHVAKVADIGIALGATVGVFGAPKQRLRGELSPERAWDLGRERLASLAQLAEDRGFVLGLEHVPPAYGGDFLTSCEEVIRMVREVDRPGLRVHLDVGCATLGGDDIAAAVASAGQLLKHFHASEPGLGSFAQPRSAHRAAAQALERAGFAGFVAIEMLEQPEPLAEVAQAVQFVAAQYASVG